MKVEEKISALRQLMREHGVAAYVVPGNDPHASEYMASHWEEMQWISGFTGESGTVVVTEKRALLWTDSRYYLQAGIELKGTEIELMRESDIDCPSILKWLMEHVEGTIGFNPEMWSVDDYAIWNNYLPVKSIDLIKPIWTEGRPAIPSDPIYNYDAKYAGETVVSKLGRMRAEMVRRGADAMVICALDEIAWLLNIRGKDVAYNPVVISYVILEKHRCTLFVDPAKVDAKTKDYLEFCGVAVQSYESIWNYLPKIKGTILFDGNRVNEAIYEAMDKDSRKINLPSPILIDKAKKNATELEGERKAMQQDGVALTRFFKWLEEEAFANGKKQTEWTIMEKLHAFRAMGEHFTDESFCTIAGYKGNGAIVHYMATKDNCAEVKGEGMLLVDSGGQYLDGTTDITRTIWLGGRIPEQAKKDYTYVMKGHIALQRIRFPRGTRGNQLDAIAKQYMWAEGITFGHGTGHGVGHFLGCHEGPQNVRTDNNPTALEVGHIISDEPGIYRTGKWGIRIENLITVVPVKQAKARVTEDEWLGFETLTLCFYDTNLMDMSMLSEDEIDWINAYHVKVYKALAPLLNEEERKYLACKCQAIEI